MPLPIRQWCALAYATLLEGMQQPAALLLLLSSVVLTGLTPVFQFHALGEEGRLARDSGLAFLLVFGLVLAATSASSSLSAEIERGTAAATLCKPVPRPLFLLAKYGGVMGLVTIFWVATLAATLLAERASEHFVMLGDEVGSRSDWLTTTLAVLGPAAALGVAGVLNFWRRARFGVAAFLGIPLALLAVLLACGCYTRFGHLTWYQLDLNGRVPAAAILIWLALAMLAALASALATHLRSGPTLAICLLLLACGLIGDLWVGPSSLWSWRGVLGGLAPNWQHFWLCDALADNGRIPWGYVGGAAIYAGTWSALALGVGACALRHRDLG
jgi:hypothetical protein